MTPSVHQRTDSVFAYPLIDWARDCAWWDLLRAKPRYESNGCVLVPADHDFRKAHTSAKWRWYVLRWRVISGDLDAAAPPPNILLNAMLQPVYGHYEYRRKKWTDYDGTVVDGFEAVFVNERGEPIFHEDTLP